MATTVSTPRIYVASLSDYVGGRLHGAWIDLDETTTADDIREAIAQMLATSPEPIAEEWAIHDYDEMPNLGEYPDLDTVAQVAAGIAEHGDPFRAWIDNNNYSGFDPQWFEDQYVGEYDSEEDYAREYVESLGLLDGVPEAVADYFDYDSYARDLFLTDFDAIPSPSGIYVFRTN